MATVNLDPAVLKMEMQVNTDKAGHFHRLAAEANGSTGMALRLMATHFEEVAGVAAGLLAAGADPGRVTGRQG